MTAARLAIALGAATAMVGLAAAGPCSSSSVREMTPPAQSGTQATRQGPQTPLFEAVLAVSDSEGTGVATCQAPGLPAGRIVGDISRGWVEDGHAIVTLWESAGSSFLLQLVPLERPAGEIDLDRWDAFQRAAHNPLARIVWWDAFPGEVGGCAIEPLDYAKVRGTLIRPPDSPGRCQIKTCDGQDIEVEDHFELEVPGGAACRITASCLPGFLGGVSVVAPDDEVTIAIRGHREDRPKQVVASYARAVRDVHEGPNANLVALDDRELWKRPGRSSRDGTKRSAPV